MFNLFVTGDAEVAALLGSLPSDVHKALVEKMRELNAKLFHNVWLKVAGGVLNIKSGALLKSIKAEVEDTPVAVYGRVFSDGSVKYAAIQEYGGVTPPHDIVPVKANVLAFVMDGKQVFSRIVHHPGSKIPERSYLRSSLREMAGEITAGMNGVSAVAMAPRQ